MMIEEDAESDCKDLSRSDNERNKVLLELFDHTVHKHLSKCAETSHQQQVPKKFMMLTYEDKHVYY